MPAFSGSLQRRQNTSVPTRFHVPPVNQTLNHTEAFVEVSIDGFSGVGTINLTVVDNLGSGSQTGTFNANISSTMATLPDGLPLTQMPPFVNGSTVSAPTAYMPTGLGTNPITSQPPISTSATTMSNFTGAPGSTASGQTDGSVSLLLVIFRAIFGGGA
jgi:hypothetical protein